MVTVFKENLNYIYPLYFTVVLWFYLKQYLCQNKLQRTSLESFKTLVTNLSPSQMFSVFSYMIFQFKLSKGAEPFFRRFIQEGLRSNWDFGWELALQVGVVFVRQDLKTPCIKNSEYKSQAKKIDSDCNFYNFSLLVPYPNKFLVVYVCILIFHGIYSPQPTNVFLWGTKFFVCVSCRQGLGRFQISWGPSVLG